MFTDFVPLSTLGTQRTTPNTHVTVKKKASIRSGSLANTSLAETIQQVTALDTNFNAQAAQLENHAGRIESLEGRFNQQNDAVGRLDTRLLAMEKCQEGVEADMDNAAEVVRHLDSTMQRQGLQVAALEADRDGAHAMCMEINQRLGAVERHIRGGSSS